MVNGVLSNSATLAGGNQLATNPSYKAISNLLAKQLTDQTPYQELTNALVKAISLKQSSSAETLPALNVVVKLKQAILDNDKINPEFKGLKDKLLTILMGIQNKLQAEPVLLQAMDDHKAFQTFDKSQSWRLMIDHWQQEKGEYGFENEPGYLGAMYGAFSHMLATVDQPLDVTLLEKLHDKAVEGVLPTGSTMQEQLVQEQYGLPEITLATNYQDQQASIMGLFFGDSQLDKQVNATEAGLIELIKGYQLEPWFEVKGASFKDGFLEYQDSKAIQLSIHAKTAAQCADIADDILSEYNQTVSLCHIESDQLAVIARCCQELARARLFPDGNTRTIGMLVVNKLLLQQNLSPVMMPNPNRFIAFSAKELASEIQQGQELYKKYTSGEAAAALINVPSYAKFV